MPEEKEIHEFTIKTDENITPMMLLHAAQMRNALSDLINIGYSYTTLGDPQMRYKLQTAIKKASAVLAAASAHPDADRVRSKI